MACTLTPGAAVDQLGEWAELRRSATAVDDVEGGVRMAFPVGLADSVRDLAAREAACCAFLDIEVSGGDEVVVEIRSEGDEAMAVVRLLTGSAE